MCVRARADVLVFCKHVASLYDRPDGRMKPSDCLKTRDADATASLRAMAGLYERTGPARGPEDEDALEIALAADGIHVSPLCRRGA